MNDAFDLSVSLVAAEIIKGPSQSYLQSRKKTCPHRNRGDNPLRFSVFIPLLPFLSLTTLSNPQHWTVPLGADHQATSSYVYAP